MCIRDSKLVLYIILFITMVSLIFIGVKEGGLNQVLLNRPTIIDSNLECPNCLIDGNTNTIAWEKAQDYSYITLDYGKPVTFSEVRFLAYSTGNERWYNYHVSYSVSGAHYTHIVPYEDTDVLFGTSWVSREFQETTARYWRFGFVVKSGFVKGGVYEMTLQKT